MNRLSLLAAVGAAVLTLTLLTGQEYARNVAHVAPASLWIVQGSDVGAATTAVTRVGGSVIESLAVINAVAARLTPAQRDALAGVRVHANHEVETAHKKKKTKHAKRVDGWTLQAHVSHNPTFLDAHLLHDAKIKGKHVAVAIIDTGMWDKEKDNGVDKRVDFMVDTTGIKVGIEKKLKDDNGHGSHIASAMLSDEKWDGRFEGMAPDADLIAIKAFDRDGQGSYLSVIRGLDWVVDNATRHNIRVVNLSFSAPARSHYWDDPINQAVMRVWGCRRCGGSVGRQQRTGCHDSWRPRERSLRDHGRGHERQLHAIRCVG